jgi:hypothetical protein
MKLLTEIQNFRISKEEKRYLQILKQTYKVNTGQFLRNAMIDYMKKEVPILRKKHKEKDNFIYPF